MNSEARSPFSPLSSSVQSYRTFVAIELPRELRTRIAEHINQLRRELPDVRASWNREDNLHLTLKFLGDVPVTNIPKLSAAIEQAAHSINSFELMVSGCGAFPPQGRPKVLWIGIEDRSGDLSRLYDALENECEILGFPREQRRFHPHLTIARLRSLKDSRRLAHLHKELGFAPQMFSVPELVVFRSELLNEGSKHTPISRHKLGNPDRTF